MMFRSPRWVIGAALSLESMRRSFIGGTSLALFIDLSGLDQTSCQRDYRTLKIYLDLEEKILENLPSFIRYLLRPFEDYHLAAQCFYETVKELCDGKGELTCQRVWETNEELADKL